AVAVAVFGQRDDQVFVVLAADFGHVVVRVDVLVAGDAVAASTGVRLLLAGFHITLGKNGRGRGNDSDGKDESGGETESRHGRQFRRVGWAGGGRKDR